MLQYILLLIQLLEIVKLWTFDKSVSLLDVECNESEEMSKDILTNHNFNQRFK